MHMVCVCVCVRCLVAGTCFADREATQVRGTSALNRLRHLGLMQREESWQCICENSVLGTLSSSQKTYLQSILHKTEAKRGDVSCPGGQHRLYLPCIG